MKIPDLNIIQPSKVASISVYYTDQQNAAYYLCIVQKNKGKIELLSKENNLSLEQLFNHLPKATPIIINIAGRVVINKHYAYNENESNAEQHIPGNQQEDFYCYEHVFNKFAGLSICRKSIINHLFELFKNKEFDIVQLSIGPFIVSDLSFLELTDKEKIPVIDGDLIISDEQGSFSFNPNKESDKALIIEGEQLKESEVIPFSQAVSYLLKLNNGSFSGDSPENISSDYLFKHFIRQLKYPVLAFFLVILLVNYFVFENYRKKEIHLEGQLRMNSGLIIKLDSLEKQLKAKERYIAIIGENRSHYSVLLDQIAASIPSKIVLEKLEMNPLKDKIKAGEIIEINKEILVAGLSSTSLVLNEWTKTLAKIDWVEDVVVLNYHKDTDKIKGEFLVRILVKE